MKLLAHIPASFYKCTMMKLSGDCEVWHPHVTNLYIQYMYARVFCFFIAHHCALSMFNTLGTRAQVASLRVCTGHLKEMEALLKGLR